MNTELSSVAPDSGPTSLAARQAPAQSDIYSAVHRALRGRYVTVAWVAAIGAIVGCSIGCLLSRPVYKSEGLIRVAYSRPAVMRETDLNQPLTMFESYLRSQQMRLVSRTAIENAMHSPVWAGTGRSDSADTVAWFVDNLAVEHQNGTELVKITFTDFDPRAATAAVQSLIGSYAASFLDQESQLQQQRLEMLEQRRQKLSLEFTTISSRADQLALVDSLLSEYLKRKATLQSELKVLEVQGYLGNHRRVVELGRLLERTSSIIDEYTNRAREMHALDLEFPATVGIQPPPAASPASSPGLWQSEASTRRDILSVDGNLKQMQRMQAESEDVRKELTETTQRMEALKMESALGGRLEIISAGDMPLMPFKNNRMKFALAGAAAGAALPLLLISLAGVARPIYRRPEDSVEDLGDRVPLLGTVPALSSRRADLLLAAGAAQSIHQMRARLQLLRSQQGKSIFLITSPCPGEGKTSITTSLALSFSASGSRTLLIDFDLIGRRLTRGFRAESWKGVHELVNGGDSSDSIRQITPSLSVMAAGVANPRHACTISASAVKRLLEKVRERYDVLLIDSGPVMGSVEASLLAAEVDGVVLTVCRGQQPRRVEHSLQYLGHLGANVVGMVFNRAEPKGFQRTSYTSSLSSVIAGREQSRLGGLSARSDGPLKYDLMVRSVIAFLPPAESTNGASSRPLLAPGDEFADAPLDMPASDPLPV